MSLPIATSPHTWIDFSDSSTLFDATSGGSVVTNGVGIARAEDKSGNGRNFTQATSGARPTWSSGLAVFDGGDWLTSTSANSTWTFLHSTQSTVFAVVKTGVTGSPNAVYGWLGNNAGSGANRGIFYAYDNRNILTGLTNAFNCLSATGGTVNYSSLNNAGNAVVTDFRNILTANTQQVYAIQSDPQNATASNRIKIAVNGGLLVGNNQRNGSGSTDAPLFALQIGAIGNNAVPIVGDYCELIIFDSILSTTDREAMQDYLLAKWIDSSVTIQTRSRRELSGAGL
jgi:hypothetical protein